MFVASNPAFASALKQNKKLIFLCGAGVSMSLGKHGMGWAKWIESSEKFLSADEAAEVIRRRGGCSSDELIDAAGYTLAALKDAGTYVEFMDSTIGAVRTSDESLAASFQLLSRMGDLFATTNFDTAIEQATGLNNVSYSNPSEIFKILDGGETAKVIHVHGLYDSTKGIDDIIADRTQYDAILANKGAQFVQNLLSTYTLVILGCGATTDDPNIRGFLSFAASQLKLDISYFYLHCAKDSADDIASLPGNITPICYGSDYNDFSEAVRAIADFRMKVRFNNAGIFRVNPYRQSITLAEPSARLHYTNGFNQFVGRKKELTALDEFRNCGSKYLWWTITGEGGIGKSRLVYEWVKNLPGGWFGFFAKTHLSDKSLMDRYRNFEPFANTVAAIDYVAGNEDEIAKIVTCLMDSFELTPFKLRIIFIERKCEPEKYNWFDTMCHQMEAQDRNRFLGLKYKPEYESLSISELSESDEVLYVKSYLKSCEKYADADISTIDAVSIQQSFRKALPSKYYRPLFLGIYTELWLQKMSAPDVSSFEGMLESFVKKEEDRWNRCLGESRPLLNSYSNLLALACATEVVCLQDPQGMYQPDADNLLTFVDTHQVPGRKETDFSDLFITFDYAYQHDDRVDNDTAPETLADETAEFEETSDQLIRGENGAPIILTNITPLYPDIIKEFIVGYYVKPANWIPFSQLAREQEIFGEYAFFLTRALEDFPEKDSFKEMAFAPVQEDGRLSYYLFLLGNTRMLQNLDGFEKTADILLRSTFSDESLLVYELELWRRLPIVMGDYVEEAEKSENTITAEEWLDGIVELAGKFAEYLDARTLPEDLREYLPELMDAYLVQVHNSERIDDMANMLEQFDDTLSRYNDGYVATFMSENYGRLLVLHGKHKDTPSVKKDWDKILSFYEQFATDADILSALAKAAEDLDDYAIEQDLPGIVGRLRKKLEDIVEAGLKNADRPDVVSDNIEDGDSATDDALIPVAGILAILEANLYEDIVGHEEQVSDQNKKAEAVRSWKIIECLYKKYPTEEHIVLAYACTLTGNFLSWMEYPRPVAEELIENFKDWIDRYPDHRLELNECYSRVLLDKWLWLKSLGTRESDWQAETIYQEVCKISRGLKKEFPDEQVGDVVEMMKAFS